MEPKRIALAVAISFAVFFLWTKFFAPPPHPNQPALQHDGASAPLTPVSPGTPGSPGAEKTAGVARPEEERVALESPAARFVLSSWGASLREVELKEPKFARHEAGRPPIPYQIIGTTTPETAPLLISFPTADFKVPELAVWKIVSHSPDAVVFRTENDDVAVEKRYKLTAAHRLWLDVVVENRSDKAQSASLGLHLFGKQNPETKGGGMFGSASASITSMLCYIEGNRNPERSSVEALVKESNEKIGPVRWVAADDKYYLVAAVLPEDPTGVRKCVRRAVDSLTAEVVVVQPSKTTAPHASTVYGIDVFGGPKYTLELDAVNNSGGEAHLRKAVDVTLDFLSKPLLWFLKAFHRVIGNWGVAIIMLTLFVKLVTLWPAHRAMMSGRKMQRLSPKMAELRKKFENDKQRLQIETMKLYKQEGVSPFLGGCLPSLLTMPIWIALFSTLNYAVELHREPFFWYIHDLSAPDPFRVPLPLLMGVIMFLQMRMSPTGGDPQQQKMMSVMMPIMFTAFSFFLPAGLCIYTMTNSLLGITHQVVVSRISRKLDNDAPTPARTDKAKDKVKGKA